jgi:hypothetical protein
MAKRALWFRLLKLGCFTALWIRSVLGGTGIAEFTAVEEIRHRARDGSEVREVLVHMARRDGAMVNVRKEVAGREVGNRVPIDPVRKARITIEPRAEAVTTYPLEKRELEFLLNPQPRCGAPEGAEESFRPGFRVYKVVRRPDTRDGQTLVTEKWLAPDLRCLPLEGVARFLENGVEFARNESMVLRVEVGKNEPELFEVPANYREMRPSEALAEAARRTGRECTACLEGGAGRLDEAYLSHQKRKE